MARGNDAAADELLPIVYDELRRLAGSYLRNEPPNQTLQPTALVHEAYLRIVGPDGSGGSGGSGGSHSCANRAQFFAIAARAMRRLLIDHARRRRAVKRGGDRRRLPLEDVNELSVDRDEYVVALDDALTELAELDPQLSRVIELRFFGGLNVEETALVIGVSPVTVKRRWRMAKGWLHREIVKGA